jgi:hypothetical protein
VTDKHLDEALNNISNLSFIDKWEFISKFVKDDKIKYSIRFYIKNYDGLVNTQIEQYFNEIKNVFTSFGFVL